MRILIADKREGLGGALVTALAHRHDVRMLEQGGGDPRHPDAAAEAAQESETVVLAPPFVGPDAPDGEILDAAARDLQPADANAGLSLHPAVVAADSRTLPFGLQGL